MADESTSLCRHGRSKSLSLGARRGPGPAICHEIVGGNLAHRGQQHPARAAGWQRTGSPRASGCLGLDCFHDRPVPPGDLVRELDAYIVELCASRPASHSPFAQRPCDGSRPPGRSALSSAVKDSGPQRRHR